MNLSQRINAIEQLGLELLNISNDCPSKSLQNAQNLHQLINELFCVNNWFTPNNVRFSIQTFGLSLKKENLEKWIKRYHFEEEKQPKTIGVVMAGNIPLAGFHDVLSVLISGNKILAKVSSSEGKLTKTISDLLIEIEPRFAENISFSDTLMKNCDAYIATGSNNTARYFEQYFKKYPHIIRHHRNAVAVLNGKESENEIEGLANDMFQYYGLGCRNVSKLLVPKGFDIESFAHRFDSWNTLNENAKYFHNYIYNKTIFLVNQEHFSDNGFLLLKNDQKWASPIAVVYYEEYENLENVHQLLLENQNNLQCVVSNYKEIKNAIPFGKAQQPELWDYADNVDTIEFLNNL